MKSISDVERMGYVRKSNDESNNEWYTPINWINAAFYILGEIQLDPMSSDFANKNIKANKFYTKEENALNKSWKSNTLWLNPPYSGGAISKCIDKLIDEYKNGNIKSAMILVNNMTDTKWYRKILDISTYECITTGRISFTNAAGQRISGNTRGQTCFLLSTDNEIKNRFVEKMNEMGHVVRGKI